MDLYEANDRLKKTQLTEEQLQRLNTLYILLDLDKDVFCKIIDAAGVDKLLEKEKHFERLRKAEEELTEKERYQRALDRLDEVLAEEWELQEYTKGYRDKNKEWIE